MFALTGQIRCLHFFLTLLHYLIPTPDPACAVGFIEGLDFIQNHTLSQQSCSYVAGHCLSTDIGTR